MKTIIVEDSRLARNELRAMLKEFPSIEIIGESGSVDDAYSIINSTKVDLIFLDINMPGKNGFQLLEMLDDVPMVIFTTAYDEFAIKSFEYNTLDYLLKPVKKENLSRAVSKAEKSLTSGLTDNKTRLLERVFIKDGEKCWLVNISEIVMFASEGNYARVYFAGNKPLILKSLNSIEEKLDLRIFFRANRKEIINLNYIKSVKQGLGNTLNLIMENGTSIEVSRRNTQKIKDVLSF